MSFYVTIADFLLEYDEFVEMPEEKIQIILDKTESKISVEQWGNNTTLLKAVIKVLSAHDLAIKYRHQLTIGGALSVINNRQQPKWDNLTDYYKLTPYGLEYLDFVKTHSLVVGVTVI